MCAETTKWNGGEKLGQRPKKRDGEGEKIWSHKIEIYNEKKRKQSLYKIGGKYGISHTKKINDNKVLRNESVMQFSFIIKSFCENFHGDGGSLSYTNIFLKNLGSWF